MSAPVRRGDAVRSGQTVEELEPDRDGELLHGDLDRRVVQQEDTAVDVSIPAVDGVSGPPTQRPCGQVEPER